MFVVELSKEHETLPLSETIAIMEGESIDFSFELKYPIVFINSNSIDPVIERASMARWAGIFYKDIKNFDEIEMDLDGKTFMVRYRNFSKYDKDTREIEREIGKKINGIVSLENPQEMIYFIEMDNMFIVRNVRNVNREFMKRVIEKRPYRTNTSLQPKIARLLVNMARVKKGMRIIDPFCGTGSIIMESASMGIESVGMDRDPEMVHASIENLKYFNLNAEIYQGDFSEAINFEEFDAVVTDPPYGRASSTYYEPLEKLYSRMFDTFYKILKPNGHVSLFLPKKSLSFPALDRFRIIEMHKINVHRSLVRFLTVFEKL